MSIGLFGKKKESNREPILRGGLGQVMRDAQKLKDTPPDQPAQVLALRNKIVRDVARLTKIMDKKLKETKSKNLRQALKEVGEDVLDAAQALKTASEANQPLDAFVNRFLETLGAFEKTGQEVTQM